MKKNILIIGPIADFGGREVEVGIIAQSLEDEFSVSILSTGIMTENSFALLNLKRVSWNTLNNLIFKKNIIYRLLAHLLKIKRRDKLKLQNYVSNGVSKKIGLKKSYYSQLKKEINKTDVVVICAQPSSFLIDEIILIANKLNTPICFRTTGTIGNLNSKKLDRLKRVTCFIHHSQSNAQRLNEQQNLPYVIIDQCSIWEDKLLNCSIHKQHPLTYGYLGRFAVEKGFLSMLNHFVNLNVKLIIAGSGPLTQRMQKMIRDCKNINYIGALKNTDIDVFFKKVDVLVIPSYEESGPLVGLEAMAAGKIIISTKVGAMEERLKETSNNYWFDTDDKQSLLKCIENLELKTAFELTELAQELRKTYLEKYAKKNIKKQYLAVINSVLKKNNNK